MLRKGDGDFGIALEDGVAEAEAVAFAIVFKENGGDQDIGDRRGDVLGSFDDTGGGDNRHARKVLA